MDPVLIHLFIAVIFLIVGVAFHSKGQHLIKRGRKAEAIIFKNNFKSDKNGGSYYPVVRFLTERKEWITQELSIGYSQAKPEGSKVEVLYDPLDPSVVELNSRFQLEILPKIFIAAGILALLIALLLSFGGSL
ncbi:MAG TPA: DUF3592 domain-containing protein [Cyclobacteriaceae bacterium]|nr:DUF3592 domain-containing protein [Cyclobacteriaceae bacterium]